MVSESKMNRKPQGTASFEKCRSGVGRSGQILVCWKDKIGLNVSIVSVYLKPSLRSSEKSSLLKGNRYQKLEIFNKDFLQNISQ